MVSQDVPEAGKAALMKSGHAVENVSDAVLILDGRVTQGGRAANQTVLPHPVENPLPLVANLWQKLNDLCG